MDTILTRRKFSLGLLLMGVTAPTASAAVEPTGAEKYVKSLTGQVLSLANSGSKGKALQRKFSSLLNRHVNMRQIANFALGTYQRKLPAGDKEMFYGLVSNYAAALFAYYVDDFKGSDIEIIDTSKQGNFLLVSSRILGGERIKWRLSGGGSSYRVSDVNIKGVWMTISMKKRFNDVLNRNKGDFKALYQELREAETW